MPYQARSGYAADPSWISRQTAWLGDYLGVKVEPGERHRTWLIGQLLDCEEDLEMDTLKESDRSIDDQIATCNIAPLEASGNPPTDDEDDCRSR